MYNGELCVQEEWPCLICRAQSKTRYLHQHPSQAADLLAECYSWEQDDLYCGRPLQFELSMLAEEKSFFNPATHEALYHYADVHVPSYLQCGQICDEECDWELGGCTTCAEHITLFHLIGPELFNDWIAMTCKQFGICPGCGGSHEPDEE